MDESASRVVSGTIEAVTAGCGIMSAAAVYSSATGTEPFNQQKANVKEDVLNAEDADSAHDVVQYEKLKSSYAANEITNAERTGSALKDDSIHRSASFLSEEQLANGRTTSFTGSDGNSYTLLQVEGQLNGDDGIFEYILNSKGQVTHQRFINGGIFTGFPNQKVPEGGY